MQQLARPAASTQQSHSQYNKARPIDCLPAVMCRRRWVLRGSCCARPAGWCYNHAVVLGRLVPPSYIRSAARCDVTRCDVRRRHGDTRTHVFHAKRSAGAWMSSRRFFDDYTPVNRMHHSKRPFFLENLDSLFRQRPWSVLPVINATAGRYRPSVSAAYKFA